MLKPTATLFFALLALAASSAWAGPGAATLTLVEAEQGKKGSPADDFLMFGTVFTERGFALPGAEVRVRRANEKKLRGEARSDSRGEFAVRVPRGAEYEMIVSAKGYREESRKVDARTGNREDLVFLLEPASGEKPR